MWTETIVVNPFIGVLFGRLRGGFVSREGKGPSIIFWGSLLDVDRSPLR